MILSDAPNVIRVLSSKQYIVVDIIAKSLRMKNTKQKCIPYISMYKKNKQKGKNKKRLIIFLLIRRLVLLKIDLLHT